MSIPVAIYNRVSTDEQKLNTSLEFQEQRLTEYCQRNGYSVVLNLKEDHSAKDFEHRPVWQSLCSIVKKNKTIIRKVLILRWDRFSRNHEEAMSTIKEFKKLGIEINAIEQPIDFMDLNAKLPLMLALLLPEMDNDRRSVNCRNGIRQRLRQGFYCNRPPFAYSMKRNDSNRPILVQNDKAKLVKLAFERYASGLYQIEELRLQMRRDGLKLAKSQFSVLLRNITYSGRIYIPAYEDEPAEIVQGVHEPIISEELYEAVQEVLKGKTKPQGKHNKIREELPMRGHLLCHSCNKVLTGSASRSRNKQQFYYYHCKGDCKTRYSVHTVHSTFENWLGSISIKPEIGQLYLAIIKEVYMNNSKGAKMEIAKLELKIKENDERLTRAALKLVDGELDKESYTLVKQQITQQTVGYKLRISELLLLDQGMLEFVNYGFSLVSNLRYYYRTTTIEGKQKMLGLIFPEKLYFSNNTCRTATDSGLLSLLAATAKDFREDETKIAAISSDNSCSVVRSGLFSNQLFDEFRRLYDLKPFVPVALLTEAKPLNHISKR